MYLYFEHIWHFCAFYLCLSNEEGHHVGAGALAHVPRGCGVPSLESCRSHLDVEQGGSRGTQRCPPTSAGLGLCGTCHLTPSTCSSGPFQLLATSTTNSSAPDGLRRMLGSRGFSVTLSEPKPPSNSEGFTYSCVTTSRIQPHDQGQAGCLLYSDRHTDIYL